MAYNLLDMPDAFLHALCKTLSVQNVVFDEGTALLWDCTIDEYSTVAHEQSLKVLMEGNQVDALIHTCSLMRKFA